MPWPPPPADHALVILSGAGLSAASGVPTFRGEGGLWQGHRAEDLATPQAFTRNPELVRRFYDMRRRTVEAVQLNDGHRALVRLQDAWGPRRVVLVTQNVDGLLQQAADDQGLSAHIIEMHGSLRRLRCAQVQHHPRAAVAGDQDPDATCSRCGGALRPDVVWFGEVPQHMDEIGQALLRCGVFLSVGTSGMVYPAAGFVQAARQHGARCLEINPDPTGGTFHDTLAEGAETALPRLVDAWLS